MDSPHRWFWGETVIFNEKQQQKPPQKTTRPNMENHPLSE